MTVSIDSLGYTCPRCGVWVMDNSLHNCLTSKSIGWQCQRCGQWVFGTWHDCNPGIVVGTFYPPVPAPVCNHCYCIDMPPSGERTKPHARCCKCSDVRLKER